MSGSRAHSLMSGRGQGLCRRTLIQVFLNSTLGTFINNTFTSAISRNADTTAAHRLELSWWIRKINKHEMSWKLMLLFFSGNLNKFISINQDVTRVSGGAGLAGLSKAMFGISTAALRLGHRTGERPRACAHFYGAVAGGPHVSVHTHSPIYINGQAWRTLAAEGALGVDAAAIHANARSLTLVDVWQRERTEC